MTTSPDWALLDANILVYADQSEDEHHAAVKALRDRGQRGECSLCVCPQVLNEYFAVITSPRRITHPLDANAAMAEVNKYVRSQHIHKIYSTFVAHDHLKDLLEDHPVSGPGIFDLYLVATMLENDIHRIYPTNTKHFTPFSKIEVLTPPEPTPTQA